MCCADLAQANVDVNESHVVVSTLLTPASRQEAFLHNALQPPTLRRHSSSFISLTLTHEHRRFHAYHTLYQLHCSHSFDKTDSPVESAIAAPHRHSSHTTDLFPQVHDKGPKPCLAALQALRCLSQPHSLRPIPIAIRTTPHVQIILHWARLLRRPTTKLSRSSTQGSGMSLLDHR